MNLPVSLNRKAVKQAFPRVREATWDNLFDYEKNNGLHACRVEGPDKYAHYDVQKLMLWLIQRGLYRSGDFYEPGEILYVRYAPTIRTHVLVG
jgi:hypothetical protein